LAFALAFVLVFALAFDRIAEAVLSSGGPQSSSMTVLWRKHQCADLPT
jgi:hypothetical protein